MNKNFYTIIFSILFFGLIVYFFILPNWDATSSLQRDLSTWQTMLKEAQEAKQNLPALREKYNALREEENKIMEAVPSREDLPSLIVQAEALASQSGLILNGITFAFPKEETVNTMAVDSGSDSDLAQSQTQPATYLSESGAAAAAPSTVSTLVVGLGLSGKYLSLRNFLREMEKNLRLADVSAISFPGDATISSGGSTVSSEAPSIRVDVNFYYKK